MTEKPMIFDAKGAPDFSQVDVPDVVSATWLADALRHDAGRGGIVVLCASMGNPAKSLLSGIPGAHLADIEGDFSAPDAEYPHTAPDDVAGPFAARGISDDTIVIIYDRHGVVVSPRVWWLARIAGVRRVAVLDGGLPAWVAAGGDTVELNAEPRVSWGTLSCEPRWDLLVDTPTVEEALSDPAVAVVDARSAARFAGVAPEPRPHMRSGHMPGSANVPFESLFGPDGTFLPADRLREIFEAAVGDSRRLVFSCGSGVTACVDALGALLAGYEDLAVYDGSWSEWGSMDSQQPIAT